MKRYSKKRYGYKRSIGFFMMLMTVFSSVFVLTYAAMYLRSREYPNELPDHSDTLYRRLASSEPIVNASTIDKEDSIEQYAEKTNTESGDTTDAAKKTETTPERDLLPKIETVSVKDADTGTVREMELEQYVACAVLAEMPINAPSEALKAQAVACRTLAVRFVLETEKSAHDGADICTSPAHCQGYTDTDAFAMANGDVGKKAVENVKNAVLATKGNILLYDGEPIVAAFHASSGGKTASSLEVWGGDVGYLVSVETDEMYDETLSSEVVKNVSFEKRQLLSLLAKVGIEDTEKLYDRPFSEFLSGVTRTESGRVDFVEIDGKRVEGETIRRALGLRSCDFSFSYTDDTVTFTTVGYGHGVGMSQLGAVEMAKDGESYYSILSRYYPGCKAGTV